MGTTVYHHHYYPENGPKGTGQVQLQRPGDISASGGGSEVNTRNSYNSATHEGSSGGNGSTSNYGGPNGPTGSGPGYTYGNQTQNRLN
jgi:hypothetical protein